MESANLVSVSYNGYELDGWNFPTKKGDPRTPIISCSIQTKIFHNAICDLGSSINIMSKEHYEKLFYTELVTTFAYVQLADQTTCYIERVMCDVLVKVRNNFVPTDFMILDMGNRDNLPLIHGRPFLNTVNACIFVASGSMDFYINGK
jgi:hypothetical protein